MRTTQKWCVQGCGQRPTRSTRAIRRARAAAVAIKIMYPVIIARFTSGGLPNACHASQPITTRSAIQAMPHSHSPIDRGWLRPVIRCVK